MEKSITQQKIKDLSDEEAVRVADGHRVNEEKNMYAFDAKSAIWGYKTNKDGKDELVFSVIFNLFNDMNEFKIDDFEFMGGFFVDVEKNSVIVTNNAAHQMPGSGGKMWAIGWRGASDQGF
ncbi:hypothetical protein FRC06_002019 [Ceratobasidium sp. 370]|nr:hypothetical protein FRC06_002019 [Ceratobasidium sp. 370]